MIYGIGTDIVSIARLRASLARFGDRLARRILTEREWGEFLMAAQPAQFLAKRFAAKEAAAKAMGTGFSRGMQLRHIGVSHDVAGRPGLEYHGRAQELKDSLGIGESHLSVADERDYAIAFVTLLKKS